MAVKSGRPTGAGRPRGTAEQKRYYRRPRTPSGTPRRGVAPIQYVLKGKTVSKEVYEADVARQLALKKAEEVKRIEAAKPKPIPKKRILPERYRKKVTAREAYGIVSEDVRKRVTEPIAERLRRRGITTERIATAATIPTLIGTPSLYPSIKERQKEFVRGEIKAIREDPLKAGLWLGGSAAAVRGAATLEFGAVRYGAPLLKRVPKIARVAKPIITKFPKVAKAGLYGLTGLYGLEKEKQIREAKRPFFEAGKIFTGELAPLFIGAGVGERLARPTKLKTAFEKEVIKLPPKVQKKFRAEWKKAERLRGLKPFDIPLGGVKTYPGKRLPIKAEKAIRDVLKREGAVWGGSGIQPAYYPRGYKGKLLAHDIDVFYGAKKPVLFKGRTPRGLATKIMKEFKVRGIKDFTRVGAKIRMKEAGKILEIHPRRFEPGVSTLESFGYAERPTITPEGIKIITAREQARRKLAGAFIGGREKDIPSFQELKRATGLRIAAEERGRLFKTYELFPSKRGMAGLGFGDITGKDLFVGVVPRRISYPKYPKTTISTYPIYKPITYKPTIISPSYKPPKYPKKLIIPYKPPKITPPYKPVKITPPYKPVKYKPTPILPTYRPVKITPPYKPPKYKPTRYAPYTTYPLRIARPIRPPALFFRPRRPKPRPYRPTKPRAIRYGYVPSFFAQWAGIFERVPERELKGERIFTGLELRPIPIFGRKVRKKMPKKKKGRKKKR